MDRNTKIGFTVFMSIWIMVTTFFLAIAVGENGYGFLFAMGVLVLVVLGVLWLVAVVGYQIRTRRQKND